MAKSIEFLKEEFRRKLRQYGLSDERVEEVTRLFERSNHHIDVISFAIMLERYGVTRRNISEFLKDSGIDDITIINIFGRVDLKKTEVGSKEITQVVFED
jgi:hypothetical protein